MYYVNREQIQLRLDFVPQIIEACKQILQQWEGATDQGIALAFSQERALHLAIETITDVGHLIIDGFLMRDASSYEDIIEILEGETVFSTELAARIIKLVRLRKSLVQDFVPLQRDALHPLIPGLPALLEQFSQAITLYLDKELGSVQ